MDPVRSIRSRLWWPIIPIGWVLVGVLHVPGLWVVMIVLTLLAAGVFGSVGLHGGCSERRGVERRQRERRRYDGRRSAYGQSHGSPHDRPAHTPGIDLRKHDDGTGTSGSLADLARDGRLPADVRSGAVGLDRECRDTLQYLHERGADAAEVFQVEQIANDFGPQTLRSYLALAPQTADTQVLADGKTGHQLVCEHLGLLTTAVRERMSAAARLGNDPLVAHHRFLTEKFGKAGKGDDLSL